MEAKSDIETRTQKPDVYGWKNVAAAIGVSESTAIRYANRGLPVFTWGPRLIVAYRKELEAWALQQRQPRVA